MHLVGRAPRTILYILGLIVLAAAVSPRSVFAATPSATKKPTPTATHKPTPTPTKKPTPTPTKKPTPTPTRKPTPTATKKPTPTATKKPTPTPTRKPSSTPTAKPTAIPTCTAGFRPINFTNRCAGTIWVGGIGNPSPPAFNATDQLVPNASAAICVPNNFSAGRFWARTACNFISPDPKTGAACQTGDCGGGLKICGHTSGKSPVSLAEVTMLQTKPDFYDVSLVDGAGPVPVEIEPFGKLGPQQPATTPWCGRPGCVSDCDNGLGGVEPTEKCPWDLVQTCGGHPEMRVVASVQCTKPADCAAGATCSASGQCVCTRDTQCAAGQICGVSPFWSTANKGLTCGAFIGCASANTICGYDNGFGNPLNCLTSQGLSVSCSTTADCPNPVDPAAPRMWTCKAGKCVGNPCTTDSDCNTATYPMTATCNTTSKTCVPSDWNLYGCNGANNASCYTPNLPPTIAPQCCGCANWSPTGACHGQSNTRWVSLAEPTAQVLHHDCPSGYAFAYDDHINTFGCQGPGGLGTNNTVGYQITFCPK